MCLAVPAQVIAINGDEAHVDMSGVRLRISVALTPEVRVGDYVLVHTGFSINVLDEQEAQETLRLFEELEAYRDQTPKGPDREVP
jgi:hydrogenase expression/formation protein HypC